VLPQRAPPAPQPDIMRAQLLGAPALACVVSCLIFSSEAAPASGNQDAAVQLAADLKRAAHRPQTPQAPAGAAYWWAAAGLVTRATSQAPPALPCLCSRPHECCLTSSGCFWGSGCGAHYCCNAHPFQFGGMPPAAAQLS
jgi:hypothetical protein